MRPRESAQARRAPCPRGGRLQHGRAARPRVDSTEVAAGERGVVDEPVARGGDAVGTWAAGCAEDLQVAGARIETPVDAALAREPQHAAAIEHRRVQVGIAGARGQAEQADRLGARVDAHDRVETAVGDPGRAVRADDDAVRRGARPERDVTRSPGARVQTAERPRVLRRVPDAAVLCRRDVVGVRPGRHAVLAHGKGRLHPLAQRSRAPGGGQPERQRDQPRRTETDHAESVPASRSRSSSGSGAEDRPVSSR